MAKTGVKWLLDNFPKIGQYLELGVTIEIHSKFKEAEKINKSQIIDAYSSGFKDGQGLLMDKIKFIENEMPDSHYCAQLWYQKKF